MDLQFTPLKDDSGGWVVSFSDEDFPKRELLEEKLPWVSIPENYSGTSDNEYLLRLFVEAADRGVREPLYMKSLFVKNFSTPKMPQIISYRFDIRHMGGQRLSDYDNSFVNMIEEAYKNFHGEIKDLDFVMLFLLLHTTFVHADYQASLSMNEHGGSVGLVKTILQSAPKLPSVETAIKYAKMLGVFDEFVLQPTVTNKAGITLGVQRQSYLTELWDTVDAVEGDVASEARSLFVGLSVYRTLAPDAVLGLFNGTYTIENLKNLPNDLLLKTLSP